MILKVYTKIFVLGVTNRCGDFSVSEVIAMCTRYYVSNISEELKDIIEAAKKSPLAQRFAITYSKPIIGNCETRSASSQF